MHELRSIPVLRFTQWLEKWDSYDYNSSEQRRVPGRHIYMFSMSAHHLRQLSDVYKRERNVIDVEGIQRAQEVNRTTRIRRYIEFGYPFGDLNPNLRGKEENNHLRKPGWLPTAIVVNILTSHDKRRGKKIKSDHTVKLSDADEKHLMQLPDPDSIQEDDLRPFEVIDGQHRLWAFDKDTSGLGEFELPVVAFHGLDVAWQAYLFWSINISPKRINPSHAFDLYPLLRTQDWLEKTGEITVYREARAQEIAEWLYRFVDSTWYGRINMLGEKGEARVSQAAWVRSLLGSFFGTGRGQGRKGLFQSELDLYGIGLSWCRPQQIAFIMEFWQLLKNAVSKSGSDWIKLYRKAEKDPFSDKSSMLNQDMGVRSVHAVVNDLFYKNAVAWKLDDWQISLDDKTNTTDKDIETAIDSLRKKDFYEHIEQLANTLASFDWRSVDGPEVRSSGDEMTKRAYRGSGGYGVLVRHLLEHVSKSKVKALSATAESTLESA